MQPIFLEWAAHGNKNVEKFELVMLDIEYSRIIYSDNRDPKDDIDVSTTLNTSNNYWTIQKEGQFG